MSHISNQNNSFLKSLFKDEKQLSKSIYSEQQIWKWLEVVNSVSLLDYGEDEKQTMVLKLLLALKSPAELILF